MLILGIETSCDDTGVAIIEVAPTKVGAVFDILSNTVSSQVKVHAKYGGVVPNLAAREHLKNIEPCLKTALNEANVKMKDIELIAVTIGPGLIPSLLIGVHFAKALAYKFKKPIVAVNHIEAHILASIFNLQFSISNKFSNDSIFKHLFPAIALVVSGGHTQLILVKKIGSPPHQKFGVGGKYKIIGETRDDAAGECFDKVAKLLNLGYPGGPKISAEAARYQPAADHPQGGKIQLPRPMINHKNYDFSFSGLKTAVLYLVKRMGEVRPPQITRILGGRTSHIIPALCAEVQQAIIDVLISKTLRASKEYKAKTIILAGGVAANEELRKQFESGIRNQESGIEFLVPPKNLCTDNGAMIAMAGYFGARRHPAPRDNSWQRIKANANLRIGENMR